MANALAGGLPIRPSPPAVGSDGGNGGGQEWTTASPRPDSPGAKLAHIVHVAELDDDGRDTAAPTMIRAPPPARDASPPHTITASASASAATATTTTPTQFPLFRFLPAELRQDIWALSLAPRLVELHHERPTHYADDDGDRSAPPRWQSRSTNPAALAVCAEARATALRTYTVALPLTMTPTMRWGGTWSQTRRHGHGPGVRGRKLYIAPRMDMVVLLGDLQYPRLTHLLDWFRKQDGYGLRRLGLSVGPFAQDMGPYMLRMYSQTVLAGLEEFVLFMFIDSVPPAKWTTGTCLLKDCGTAADYKLFEVGHGDLFRRGQEWMVVGESPMKVVDLRFVDGWSA